MSRALLALFTAAIVVSPAEAQERMALFYAAGPSAVQGDLGLHVIASARLQTRLEAVALRVDGMFQQAQVRDLFALANVVFAVGRSDANPYFIGGTGVIFDNGGEFAWGGGIGVQLTREGSVPLFAEYRVMFAREQFSLLSMGLRLGDREP